MPTQTSLWHLPQRALAKWSLSSNNHVLSRKGRSMLVLSIAGNHNASMAGIHSRAVTSAAVTSSTPTSSITSMTTNSSTVAQSTTSTSRSLYSSSALSQPSLVNETLMSLTALRPEGEEIESGMASQPPLSKLSLTHIIRSLATTAVSSSPSLLPLSLAMMSVLATSTSPLFNPDRNPLLRYGLKGTIYRQFCAGETGAEVKATARELRDLGFSGVILCYAREVVLPSKEPMSTVTADEYEQCIADEVIPWAAGQIETVRLAQKGDCVAIKFSGAGRLVLSALARQEAPPPEVAAVLDTICSFAVCRGVKLLIDAEQSSLQAGIDAWTMNYMRRYNTQANNATIYNTYQCYLKSAPETLSKHLAMAQEEGFTLGVKLVRGAYLGHDPRELFWDTKTDTDVCYDVLAEGLLKRQYGEMIQGSGNFPDVGLCLATHNAESVRMARRIAKSGTKTDLSIAQLQGMADEVSCELLGDNGRSTDKAKAYKYITWGTTGECMKYLLRRAQENKDAVQRTRDTRDAMKGELVRRVKGIFGFV